MLRFNTLVVLSVLLMCAAPSQAITLVIGDFPVPILIVAVGTFGGTVDQVGFSVPSANVGDSTPIVGTPDIRVLVGSRASPANSRIANLTADSSTPLSNGTSTIPFTEISWLASDTDIPASSFNGATQSLMSFLNSRIIFTTHRFFYANTQVLEAGAYNGQVTYTLTMP